jgi:Predicted phosphoribosyltransferases
VDIANFTWGVLSSLVATAVVAACARYFPRGRKIPFRVVMRDIQALTKKIEDDRAFRPEAVVAISRSGAIVGGVLAGLLNGLVIDAPMVMAIRLDRKNGVRNTTITNGPVNLSDFRKVILVTCINDTGEAMRAALEWIATHAPSVQVRTAAVYSRPNALVRPDHIGRAADERGPYETAKLLVRMPWMTDSWSHDLPGERRGVTAAQGSH